MTDQTFPELGTLAAPDTFDELISLATALVAAGTIDPFDSADGVLRAIGAPPGNPMWRALDMALDPGYYERRPQHILDHWQQQAVGAAEAYAVWRATEWRTGCGD